MTTRDSDHHSGYVDISPADSAKESTGSEACEFSIDSSFPRGTLRRKGFQILNGWLLFHLFAIVICPASVEPSSPLVQAGFEFVSPYLHVLYLDHGFDYFSPDPGASTLVAYSLDLPDGSTKAGRFPDRTTYPRLLYHRYFMLTEFLGNGPEEMQPFVERAFARNLCRETGATRVSLTRVMHDMASEEQIRGGVSLNDPSLFTEKSLGTYTAEELRLPYRPPTKESQADSSARSKSHDESKDIP